jgi:hypothetical protein
MEISGGVSLALSTHSWLAVDASFASPHLLVEVLNIRREQADDSDLEDSLKAKKMLVGGFGPARLNAGEYVTGHFHSPALHSRHKHVLRPVPLEPQSADHRPDYVQAPQIRLPRTTKARPYEPR